MADITLINVQDSPNIFDFAKFKKKIGYTPFEAKLGDVLEKLSPNKRYSNFIQHVSQQSFQLTQNKVRGMPTNSARERSLNNSQLCTERH